MDTKKILKDLTESTGPSGFESGVRVAIEYLWRPLVDDLKVDRVGSLLAIKKGQGQEPRPKLMLAAHMDEIGLMVKNLVRFPDEEGGAGFIGVTPIGGVDRRHLYGQMVNVHGSGEEGRILIGVIGALPSFMLPGSSRNKVYEYEDIIVDVGLPYAELEKAVTVGDVISFRQQMRDLLNKRVTSKALDNRSSVAAVTLCLAYLQTRQHDWDVIAVATAQEETRLLGAFTSAFSERPDIAIAVDVSFAKGPGTSDDNSFGLGSGPILGVGPYHSGVFDELRETARALEMDFNIEPHTNAGGTDAFGLQIVREGVPTGLVGIPLRYMHTMVESLAIADVERVGRLLGEYVTRLDSGYMDRLVAKMVD